MYCWNTVKVDGMVTTSSQLWLSILPNKPLCRHVIVNFIPLLLLSAFISPCTEKTDIQRKKLCYVHIIIFLSLYIHTMWLHRQAASHIRHLVSQ